MLDEEKEEEEKEELENGRTIGRTKSFIKVLEQLGPLIEIALWLLSFNFPPPHVSVVSFVKRQKASNTIVQKRFSRQ
jgi:hypothetical protein